MQPDDTALEHSNDVHMHQNEEAADPVYESSDDESDGESCDPEYVQTENGDINNILIGLKGSSLRYNVCILRCASSVSELLN